MRLKELSYIYKTIKFTNLKTVYHPSESRGYANHGWLEARHSFSFANWYDPNRTHFGALRVLNDDIIAPSRGFGTHPHSNMEIITIPLELQGVISTIGTRKPTIEEYENCPIKITLTSEEPTWNPHSNEWSELEGTYFDGLGKFRELGDEDRRIYGRDDETKFS